MPKFDVMVFCSIPASQEVQVEAENEEEAQIKAIEFAKKQGHWDHDNHEAEYYFVDSCYLVQEEKT